MKTFFQKLLSLLRVRATAAGLEVSDQVVRLVYFGKNVWQMHAVRLAPGTVEEGKVKDRAAFIAALKELKAKVERKEKKKVNVVLCMSSVAAYTQMFTLPMVAGKNLEKAVELNLQMASPLAAGDAYSGWQIVEREKETATLHIVSVFIERRVVDAMVDALFEAGFLVMAVESRALSLTRLLREKGAGVDIEKSYLFVCIDSAGIDFLIMRHGMLHFEFPTPWRDFMNDKGDIPVEKFEEVFQSSMRQVLNFYGQHWPEPLGAVILSAIALGEEAEKVIAEVAQMPPARLTLIMGQPISSEWLTAFGCSLRGESADAEDREISLLGEDSEDRFHEEQLINFMRFWRAAVPIAFGLLIAGFIVGNILLVDTRNELSSRSQLNANSTQSAAIAEFQASADDFNHSVALVAAAEKATSPKSALLDSILAMASGTALTINNLSFSPNAPVSLSGTAGSEDAVTAFKTALMNDPGISAVNLPLTGVQTNGNVVSFSVTFKYTPPAPTPTSP